MLPKCIISKIPKLTVLTNLIIKMHGGTEQPMYEAKNSNSPPPNDDGQEFSSLHCNPLTESLTIETQTRKYMLIPSTPHTNQIMFPQDKAFENGYDRNVDIGPFLN